MSLRWIRTFSSIFLLLVFLGAKGLEAHGFLHADEENSPACEWCDYALVLESTPYHPPVALAIGTGIEDPLSEEPALAAITPLYHQHLEGTLFCRPPPAGPMPLV